MEDLILPQKELDLIEEDPWQRMAIEKQFRPLINQDEVPDDFPATLAYLQQERHKYDPTETSLDDTEQYLIVRLNQKRYALALLNLLWGGLEAVMLSDVMDRTLLSPEELIQEAGAFARIS